MELPIQTHYKYVKINITQSINIISIDDYFQSDHINEINKQIAISENTDKNEV